MLSKYSHLSRKSIALILSLILIASVASSILTYVVAQSVLTTPTFSGGVYSGAPKHTIFADSGMYYSKNIYGSIDGSSTNAATIIEDTVATGGITIITNDLSITQTITLTALPYGTQLINYAKVTWAGSNATATTMLEIINSNGFKLEGGIWDGGSKVFRIGTMRNLYFYTILDLTLTNLRPDLGAYIDFWNCSYGEVSGNKVEALGIGLGFNFLDGSSFNTISRNIFNQVYDSGIDLGSSGVGILVEHNSISGNIINSVAGGDGFGIKLFGLAKSNTIIGNTIDAVKFDGIASIIDGVTPSDNVISGNTITNTGRHGIFVDGQNTTVTGNTIRETTIDGIYVAGNFTTVTSNTISNVVSVGVEVYTNIKNVIVTNNIVQNCAYGLLEGANADFNIFDYNIINSYSTSKVLYNGGINTIRGTNNLG
jgi:parallel beta-helix repeat protein